MSPDMLTYNHRHSEDHNDTLMMHSQSHSHTLTEALSCSLLYTPHT